ncbi:DUF4140 domain-containing protein [Geomonas subterranea]|uniref:DUF4140 domain-containing protein n=1 Tax=Geomonas subterranea TaxID=2847989 RepID=A0ABX8LMR7_9BACT|nr:DUF4140 domain-containing protein [Geomonas subterranea]QXE90840.1 DUF4140 domain-containing protein [Geomonas subterranea]QXM11077.1 DUF4140 domain-containing protein [Geomonas subterranea]
MRLLLFALFLLPVLACKQASAGQKSVTLFQDGARVEQELPASGGYLELPLPDGFTPGSLRVKAPGGTVLRVELVPAEQDRRRSGELARLRERRGELQDRMAALTRREEIFSAAAKSQSGKAPRKTKANPDPVVTLQQGTEFALNQMEAVYRSKRKCRLALDAVERELTAASKGVASARIWVTGGKARVSYVVGNVSWSPSYDLRFSGDGVSELLLHAKLPQREKGVQYQVGRGTTAKPGAVETVRGEFPVLARYPLATVAAAGTDPPERFAFAPVEAGLPAGEAALYWKGEYLGSAPFSGGGSTGFSLGR